MLKNNLLKKILDPKKDQTGKKRKINTNDNGEKKNKVAKKASSDNLFNEIDNLCNEIYFNYPNQYLEIIKNEKDISYSMFYILKEIEKFEIKFLFDKKIHPPSIYKYTKKNKGISNNIFDLMCDENDIKILKNVFVDFNKPEELENLKELSIAMNYTPIKNIQDKNLNLILKDELFTSNELNEIKDKEYSSLVEFYWILNEWVGDKQHLEKRFFLFEMFNKFKDFMSLPKGFTNILAESKLYENSKKMKQIIKKIKDVKPIDIEQKIMSKNFDECFKFISEIRGKCNSKGIKKRLENIKKFTAYDLVRKEYILNYSNKPDETLISLFCGGIDGEKDLDSNNLIQLFNGWSWRFYIKSPNRKELDIEQIQKDFNSFISKKINIKLDDINAIKQLIEFCPYIRNSKNKIYYIKN